MPRGRVLIGDDHVLVVEGFRRILEAAFDVVGTAADGPTLVSEALRLQPDVILIDISLPVMNGIEAARQIKRDLPAAKLIFLTMHSDLTYLRDALNLGASGYLLKSAAGKELVNAVREVLAGRKYVTPEITRTIPDLRLRKSLKRGRLPGLTPRQQQILKLVASGRSNTEIAAALGLTVRTIRFHRAEITQKLGISGTTALTKYAITHGMTESP